MANALTTSIYNYRAWSYSAKPGETLCYHHGFLARDRVLYIVDPERASEGPGGYYREVRVDPLDTVATMIFDDAARGLVTLTQRRLGALDYEYIATRTRKVL